MTRRPWWRRRRGERPAERDVTGWLGTLRPPPADPASPTRVRADLGDATALYLSVLDQRRAADCVCTGTRVVVLHDPGTDCGDAQRDAAEITAQNAAARAGSGPDEMPLIQTAAYAVVDHLTNSLKEKP